MCEQYANKQQHNLIFNQSTLKNVLSVDLIQSLPWFYFDPSRCLRLQFSGVLVHTDACHQGAYAAVCSPTKELELIKGMESCHRKST